MTIAEIVFYLLAVAAIVGAIGCVTVPNVVHAALFLIISLLAVAGFYILLSSEFLALTQILVYGGAVATIILFGLMLTRGDSQLPVVGPGGQWPAGLVAAGVIMVGLLTAVLDSDWPRNLDKVTLVPIDQIGRTLFKDWLLPFEVASVVLLIALIGAVVISSAEEEEA
jgi:NADH-quinone oxidoreductase subunit J